MSKNVYYLEKYVFFDIISSIHLSRTAALLRSYIYRRFRFWAIITSTVAVEHNCNVPVLIFNTVNSVVILGNFEIERHIYHGFSTDLWNWTQNVNKCFAYAKILNLVLICFTPSFDKHCSRIASLYHEAILKFSIYNGNKFEYSECKLQRNIIIKTVSIH